MQWNSSSRDANCTVESVHISEVSSFQGLNCMQQLFLGKERVSLLERCPYFRGVLREGFIKPVSIPFHLRYIPSLVRHVDHLLRAVMMQLKITFTSPLATVADPHSQEEVRVQTVNHNPQQVGGRTGQPTILNTLTIAGVCCAKYNITLRPLC